MRNYFIFVLIIGQSLRVFSIDNNNETQLKRNIRSPQKFDNVAEQRGGNRRGGGKVHFENEFLGNDPYGQQGNFDSREHHHGHHGRGHQFENNNGPILFNENKGAIRFDNNQNHNNHHNNHHNNNGHNHGGHDNEKHRIGPDWRPRRPHGRPPPPPGYSGYRPEGWGHGGYTYDDNGDKERRISQIRFEEYMKKIYGNNFTEENSILTPEELNGREIANPGEFRHMAVIGLRGEDRTKEWKCGASLIDVNFVITAAHCTDFGGQPPTHVKIGDINLKIREDTVATQRMKISNIYVHPKYKSNSYYYDIALIRLSKPAVFTQHVRPARLWSSSEIPYELVFAMGYGATTFGKSPTEVLTFFNLTLIGSQECNTTLPINDDTPNGIIESQICAMDKKGVKDTCQGDSGGPLQLHLPGRRRTRYYLIGITSYGLYCGSKTPSVYTRIYSFLDWIEGIVWPQ